MQFFRLFLVKIGGYMAKSFAVSAYRTVRTKTFCALSFCQFKKFGCIICVGQSEDAVL